MNILQKIVTIFPSQNFPNRQKQFRQIPSQTRIHISEEMKEKEITPDDQDYQELILPPEYCNMSEQGCQKQLEAEDIYSTQEQESI